MHNLLEVLPELKEDEHTIVPTRVLNAPHALVYRTFADQKQVVEWWGPHGFGTRVTLRNRFGSRELRDENLRACGSVQGARDLFERLMKFLAAKGATA